MILATLLLSSTFLSDAIPITLASSADLYTTKIALANCTNCYEGNFLLQSHMTSKKILITTGIILLTHEIRKKNNKAGKIFKYVTIGIFSGAAINNYIQSKR